MSGLIGGILGAVGPLLGPSSFALGLPSPPAGAAIDDSGISFQSGVWAQQLVPGTWRGVPFLMDTLQTKAGRRVAIHEYPFTDGKVWPEDIGKLPRRFALQGFLIGDDVYQTRDAMLAACEAQGAGTLVIPSMGPVQVVLLDFSVTDRRERGRMVDVSLSFIQAADALDALLPTSLVSTGSGVVSRALGLSAATRSDFASVMGGLDAVLSGRAIAPVLASVGAWGGLALSAVNDATRVLHAVTGLAGLFGRYSGGNRATLLPSTATVASVLSGQITARANVVAAVAALPIAAARGAGALSDAAQSVTSALLASATDPADAIRVLLPLASFTVPAVLGNGPLAAQARTAQGALQSNLRCAALAALARASSTYAPLSYQDALATRTLVCGAVGTEITASGDDPARHATCEAATTTRAAVALDLAMRGSSLPALVEVTNTASLPSLAAAWRLYQDTTREPGLVASADPPHPLFMPLSFPALSS